MDDNGTNLALLFVKTLGLPDGTYSVHLTDVSDTNTFNLGSLNVAGSTKSFDFGLDRGRGRGHGITVQPVPGNWPGWVNQCAGTNSALTNLFCGSGATNQFCTNAFHWYTNCLTVGSGSFLLPSGLAQTNVAGIFVSDTNGAVELTGSFTGVTNSTTIYIETVSLVPGTATNVQGQATLTLTYKNGKSFPAFKLSASGLEPRERLLLSVNDTNTFRFYTSRTGTLKVNSLPRSKIVNLKSVVATDTSSNVVFSASF